MKYVIMNKGERKGRVRTTPPQITRPTILFLGGLLHVQDKETKRGFPALMHRLHGRDDVSVILPLISSDTPLWENRQHMFAFSQGKANASAYAKTVYNYFFAPHIERFCKAPDQNQEQTFQALSKLPLVGYSYGSLVIQQISGLMAGHLRARLPKEINTFEEITRICAFVKAVNIGPVCNPLTMTDNGAIRLLRTGELSETGKAPTFFSQLFFMMRDDKVVQRSLGREPLHGKLESKDGIEVISYGNHLRFHDYIGRPVHKLIGTIVSPGQQFFPKIIMNYDYILHDLRTYTNEFEVDGNLAIYPSLPIAPILRDCCQRMVEDDTTGPVWLAETKRQHTSRNALQSYVRTYKELDNEFYQTVRSYEQKTFDEGVSFLKEHVVACKKRAKSRQ